jgi:glycosyltransferase involved in cell wall biosynthesis
LIGRIAGFLYRRADHIVVVTPAFREHLIRNWRVPASKISVVQNGVETDVFRPKQVAPSLRAELGANSKFVVSYIGTLGWAHGLDTVITAAERLQSSAPNVLFLLIGDGAEREHILKLAESKKLSNVVCLPQQPRERIPEFICASDACLVLLKKSDVFATVIPTKMLEFMSCARPVILGVEGQAQQLLENARAGVCIQPEDPNALCASILQLYRQPSLANALGENGREYIVRNLSRKGTAADYLEVLGGLLDAGATLKSAAAA